MGSQHFQFWRQYPFIVWAIELTQLQQGQTLRASSLSKAYPLFPLEIFDSSNNPLFLLFLLPSSSWHYGRFTLIFWLDDS